MLLFLLTFTALFSVVRYWWCFVCMCVTLFSVSVMLLAAVVVEVDFDELWDICRGFKLHKAFMWLRIWAPAKIKIL